MITCLTGAATAQQRAVVQGRVVEFGTRNGIPADITVPRVGRVVAGGNGEFRLPDVPVGLHVVTVTALGYQTREVQLDVKGDTAVFIELEVAPVRVDSIVVRSRTITVRGHVFELATGKPVIDAEATIGARMDRTNFAGNFKVTRVPGGAPVTVEVGAVALFPAQLIITADRDTTIRVGLRPDSVGQAMLDAAVKKIEERSRAVQMTRDQWDREELMRFPRTIEQLLLQRYGRRVVPTCLFVNDINMTIGGAELLASYITDELERVEVFGRGSMVRLYTRRFAARKSGTTPLPPILMVLGMPGGALCR